MPAPEALSSPTEKAKSPSEEFTINLVGTLADQAHRASIGKWEAAFYSAALLFLYFALVSPPWRSLTFVDIGVTSFVLVTAYIVVRYEWNVEQRARELYSTALSEHKKGG